MSFERRAPREELWCVTAHFNHVGYKSRFANYLEFARGVARAGLELFTVECAFGDAPFELSSSPYVLQVRSRACLWQKERLINLGISALPPSCTKVVWVDGDVLFEREDWADEVASLLDRHVFVQPFEAAVWLTKGEPEERNEGERLSSFAAVAARDPSSMHRGDPLAHGHTGFAWAARREVLERVGLYDACPVGGADHLMAHAMCGDVDSPCIHRALAGEHLSHFRAWAARLTSEAHHPPAHASGRVLHLWHGEIADRRYVARHAILKSASFDPRADLRMNAGGCWEWASDKPDMHAAIEAYFGARNEDGGCASAAKREASSGKGPERRST